MPNIRLAVLAIAVCACAAPCGAQQVRPIPHLRSANREVIQMIGDGTRRSPTFRRLVDLLEHSDLLVYIEPSREIPRGARAELRYAGASLTHRFVRIAVHIPCATETFIALLGHELQHATEVATEPFVRDGVSLDALYRHIGYEAGAGWETRAAVAAGDAVLDELRRGPQHALANANSHQ